MVDLSRVLAGPFSTLVLADLGADVIRVEGPGGTDDTHAWKPPDRAGESVYYLGINRNKRSIILDLHRAESRAVLDRLLGQADVLVENFRSETLERMELAEAVLRPRHPQLIHARITGFGSTGPYRDLPGYDLVAQAMSGFMHTTGEPDRPGQKVGVAITDVLSGLYLAIGVSAALAERAQTGKGRYVEVALLEAGLASLANLAANHLIGGRSPRRVGNAHPSIAPFGSFRAKDGDIALAVGNDRQFARLCEAVIGTPEWLTDPRFATNPARVKNEPALTIALEERLAERPVTEWVSLCREHGVPSGPVQDLPAAFADPHVKARGMVQRVESEAFGPLDLVASPIWLDSGRLPVRMPPPVLGEHTAQVLGALAAPERSLDRS